MRIIRHGNAEKCRWLMVFTCNECGAVFETGPHERYADGDRQSCRCPCCNSECIHVERGG